MDYNEIRKILVIKLRHIGDVLLSTPVFKALKNRFNNASITALVNSGTEEVLTGNPFIDQIMVINKKSTGIMKKTLTNFRLLSDIRSKKFDITVDLTGNDRAAIVSLISAATVRVAPHFALKIGFKGKRYCYTKLADENDDHMVIQNLNVVKTLGIYTDMPEVKIYFNTKELDFIDRIFDEKKIDYKKEKIVHIHPTSRWLFKCWNDKFMAEIIQWLIKEGIVIILTSSANRNELQRINNILSYLPDNIRSKSERLIDLSGKTTIKQLAAISKRSDIFFGVDSAPMHIAASVDTPVVALFGPSIVYRWAPWANSARFKTREDILNAYSEGAYRIDRHVVIQKDWQCVPCQKDGCNGSKISRCLEEISPEEVKKVLKERIFYN